MTKGQRPNTKKSWYEKLGIGLVDGSDGVAGGEADEVFRMIKKIGQGGKSGASLSAEFAEGEGAVLLHGAIGGVEICNEQRDGAFGEAREVGKIHCRAHAFRSGAEFQDYEWTIEVLWIEFFDAAVQAQGERCLRSGYRFRTDGFSAADGLQVVIKRNQNSERGFDIHVVDILKKARDGSRCVIDVVG